jgi:hypothetical protein
MHMALADRTAATVFFFTFPASPDPNGKLLVAISPYNQVACESKMLILLFLS